jgi:ABC-type lipoprotein export system ATPase subunit
LQILKRLQKKYDKDAKSDNREDLLKQLNELQTRKWLSQQIKSIEKEIERFNLIDTLQSAKKLTNTRVLSTKKGELAKLLITNAFVFRFNSELKNLGASQIKIELIKSRVNKGRVLHKLCLQGASNNSPDDVLSEGEHRIVALSAFLADVTGKQYSAPFVFDDPISSLDQAFEETVVQRLIELSNDRQVIVFTHRLSLLGLVQDYAKKANIDPEIVCIRKETWGTGEPGDTPLFAKKPEKALNKLLNNRLPKARKLLIEHGQEVYDPYAKALCSDFRILIERMVECDLLADVVQRYRRVIKTMGKIEKLAKINASDCALFDQLMTKYSRYEHSQPIEAPVAMPTPDEMENDFKSLKNWHVDFNKKPLVVS